MFSACSSNDSDVADKLNTISYAYHYRSIDSTEVYARKAFAASESYNAGKAAALNYWLQKYNIFDCVNASRTISFSIFIKKKLRNI